MSKQSRQARRTARRMKWATCTAWPMRINSKTKESEPSKLYQEMLKHLQNRPLVNMLYAMYDLKDTKDAFDKKYKRNEQGEHSYMDLRREWQIDKHLKELIPNDSEMKQQGFMKPNGEYVLFDSSVDAVNKAYEYNKEHQFKVATVRSIGDKYTVEIMDKTSQTIQNEVITEELYTNWNVLSEEFAKKGIDINEIAKINPSVINPYTVNDFLRRIELIKRTAQNILGKENIEILLNLTKDLDIVQQALKKYDGENLHQIADRLASAFADKAAGINSVPDGEFSFMQNLINSAKNNIKVDTDYIERSIGFSNDLNRYGSLAYNAIENLTRLNEQYGIENDAITRTSREIKSMSDAVIDILFNIKRQIENVKHEINITNSDEQQKRLDELYSILETLEGELKNKNYYAGLTIALSKVIQYQNVLDRALDEMKNISTGDVINDSIQRADILAKAKNLYDAYYNIAKRLSNLNSIVADEQLSSIEKEAIETKAQIISETFEKQKNLFNEAAKGVCGDMALHYLGYSAEHGGIVAEILDSMEDAGLTDYLYSCARSSNKMIAVIGSTIREAQRERDRKLMDISKRIDRITNEFFEKNIINGKKVKDTSYIYEKFYSADGSYIERIISKINWNKFEEAKSLYYAQCRKEGMDGYQLMDAMRQWEYENTFMSDEFGRFARIPIEQYWKEEDFQEGWTDAQKTYYAKMMELKCELHELMPEYAKDIFLAPQIRKSWQQDVDETVRLAKQAKSGKERMDIIRQHFNHTLERLKLWKIKDDDTRYSKNGQPVKDTIIINGKECKVLNSTFNNNHIRNIPLFYVKKLTDETELTHDFSQAMSKLATTAVNYDAMSRIQNLVEVMSDYAKHIKINDKKDGNNTADVINTGEKILARQLVDYSEQTNTAKILETYIASQLYGRAEDPSKWSVWLNALLDITRLKALAMNVKGFISNELMGETQNIIEAIGGEFFTVKDYAKAAIQLFTNLNIMDGLTNNVNSMAGLLERRFNPIQENYRNVNEKKYYRTAFGKIFGSWNAFKGYQVGEYMIHMKNMYAVLNHTKVLKKNKNGGWDTVSLMDVLKKSQKIDGNSELYLEDNVATLDGRLIQGMDDQFFNELQKRIEYVNQTCHGAMNMEDKGVINQNDIGRLVMTFRQWMVEHYSRRYRQMHYDNSGSDPIMQNFYYDNKVFINGEKHSLYDAFEKINTIDGGFKLVLRDDITIKDKDGITVDNRYVENLFNAYLNSIGYREGFTRTMFKFINSFTFGWNQQFGRMTFAEAWDNLSDNQKYNVKRFMGAVSMFVLCFAQVRFAPAPRKKNDPGYDEDDFIQSYAYKLWYYEIKRMMMEENASAPWGIITEGNKLINQPIPAQSIAYGLAYPVLGLIYGDAGKTVEKGKHKDENKYWKNLKTYTFPFTFIGQYENIRDFAEDPDIYKIFERQYKAY